MSKKRSWTIEDNIVALYVALYGDHGLILKHEKVRDLIENTGIPKKAFLMRVRNYKYMMGRGVFYAPPLVYSNLIRYALHKGGGEHATCKGHETFAAVDSPNAGSVSHVSQRDQVPPSRETGGTRARTAVSRMAYYVYRRSERKM